MRDNKDVLSKKEVEDTKKYSVVDGSAYNVMYGFGEQYVTPYALKLGATSAEIGILASVPSFVGALFQIVGATLTDKYQNRKRVVTLFVFLQAMTLLPLFILPLLTKSILLLTVIFSVYLMFANAVAPAWNSWIGAVIPDKDRASYFSRRNKITISVLVLSVLIAGMILNHFTNTNIWIGFGILFSIAFIGRIISWYYLMKQTEPRYVVDKESYFSFKDFLKRLPETNFGNFVLFRSLVALSVMIASPFFAVYMLRDLNFTYIEYMTIVLVPMLVKVFTMTYWGKYSKKVGTRNIMIISSFLIALIPVVWFIIGYFAAGKYFLFYLIICAEMVSGFAWAGFELTTFNYVLETVSPQKRARAVAYFNVIFGTAVLIGGLSGSWLVTHLPTQYKGISTMLLLFLISAAARFIVPIIFLPKLKEVMIRKDIDETKLFIDLVISKPLHAALHQTAQIMFLTEGSVEKIKGTTGKGLQLLKRPVAPVINGVTRGLTKGLDKIEPLRKSIEPKALKKYRRRDYEYLVNHDYEKYLRTPKKEFKKDRTRK
ncbi:MAG: MFS transporter [Candidatus Woesearchaeota archaeon]